MVLSSLQLPAKLFSSEARVSSSFAKLDIDAQLTSQGTLVPFKNTEQIQLHLGRRAPRYAENVYG